MVSMAERLRELLRNEPNPGWQDLKYVGNEVEGWKVLDVIEGDEGRWSRNIQVIVEERFTGDIYRFSYDRGLTEYQDDDFPDELPERVYPHEQVVVNRIWSTQPARHDR